MPDNRVYPSNTDEQANVAATLNSIAKSDLIRGTHYGLENPRGVGFPDSFDGYTPIHIIANPSDGINDGANFVTYFQKDGTSPAEFYKATNADTSTLSQLTSGAEFDLVSPKELNRNGLE